MKTENLYKIRFAILLILLFKSGLIFSQYQANLILVIDGEIVTQNVKLEFINQMNDSELIYNYKLGDDLKIPEEYFKENSLHIKFEYYKIFEDSLKSYNYDFEFLKGWLTNTTFLILRIYNLDKKEYKKLFCNEQNDYVIEVENSVYKQQKITCKKNR
jgi:hypothetical protein